MCLIALAQPAGHGARLLVAANRDEFFERPTAPAAFWEDHPHVLAGRDRRAGGTWLGVSRTGRFAAITNYRNPRDRRDDAPSRGALVSDFLIGTATAEAYARDLHGRGAPYNGFSLLVFDGRELWFCSNRDHAAYRVDPGVHGLSNHLPDGHLGRMAVLAAWRRQGVGMALANALIARASERGDAEIVLHAQIHAVGFYRKLGFKPRGPEFDEAGIPHVEMARRLLSR